MLAFNACHLYVRAYTRVMCVVCTLVHLGIVAGAAGGDSVLPSGSEPICRARIHRHTRLRRLQRVRRRGRRRGELLACNAGLAVRRRGVVR